LIIKNTFYHAGIIFQREGEYSVYKVIKEMVKNEDFFVNGRNSGLSTFTDF
jgi:hypothetical protein